MSQSSDATTLEPREVVIAVKRFLGGYHPEGVRGIAKIGAQRNLWTEVNSLTLLELVVFVEDKFAIKVQPIDFAPQNFSSLEAIARFVVANRRQSAGQ